VALEVNSAHTAQCRLAPSHLSSSGPAGSLMSPQIPSRASPWTKATLSAPLKPEVMVKG
jgi:hypothetical protein